MEAKKYTIWEQEEYYYKRAGKFIPNLRAFLHEDGENHPAMLIAPGGAWTILTPTEANSPAQCFFERGYNTFVLSYTNNVTLDAPVGMQPLKDISRAVKFIRKNAAEFKINPNRVIGCGFSAGGHLVAALSVHHDKAELNQKDGYEEFSNRLDAALVNYGVISFIEHKLPGGYSVIFGEEASEEQIRDISLNLNVKEDSSPMFIMHGMCDSLVPWQHAMLMAEACSGAGVPCEVHLFQNGEHGLTNFDATPESTLESFYVMEQLYEVVHAMSGKELTKYSPLYGDLNKEMDYDTFMKRVFEEVMMQLFITALRVTPEDVKKRRGEPLKPNPSVGLWQDMAENWINMVL